jgi:hypothetical protein
MIRNWRRVSIPEQNIETGAVCSPPSATRTGPSEKRTKSVFRVLRCIVYFAMLAASSVSLADDTDDARDKERQRAQREQEQWDQFDRDQKNYPGLNSPGRYAAIAYSPSTGKHGNSYNHSTLAGGLPKDWLWVRQPTSRPASQWPG